jgi:hypothetical protein
MEDKMEQKVITGPIPAEGIHVNLPKGETFTRINLELGPENITLATVGAASGTQATGHAIILKRTTDGLVLSLTTGASREP